jgi:hypothetical protein
MRHDAGNDETQTKRLARGRLPGGISISGQKTERTMPDVRLMTVDPGHFHAALVQKEMYAGVSERVDVFAPVWARPKLIQKTWDDVLRFIYGRFSRFDKRKTDHEQWDEVGQQLWKAFLRSRVEDFSSNVRKLAGLM